MSKYYDIISPTRSTMFIMFIVIEKSESSC